MPKIARPLTAIEIDRAKPKPKEYNLNDGNGLYLRVRPSGRKLWLFNYIAPSKGKRTNAQIGYYPDVTLANARAKREEYRGLLAQGIDPQTHRAKLQQESQLKRLNSFQAVAERWRDKKLGEVEEKTALKYWRSLELHILPKLGAYSISEIVPTLVIPVLQIVEKNGRLDMVSRLCGYINEILNFASNGGLIPFNPCAKIGKVFKKPTKQNNPNIDADELPQLLATIATANIEPITRAVLRFQLLTMTRPTEASSAKWSEIDFKKKLWTIPPERMKTRQMHVIPLSTQAVEILQTLHEMTGHCPYIFPKYNTFSEPMSKESAATALRRNGYKGKQTAHGFRGLARTYLADMGIALEQAEACLSHRTGSQVSQAYNHSTYLEQRKDIMQQWADFIAQCAPSYPLAKLCKM